MVPSLKRWRTIFLSDLVGRDEEEVPMALRHPLPPLPSTKLDRPLLSPPAPGLPTTAGRRHHTRGHPHGAADASISLRRSLLSQYPLVQRRRYSCFAGPSAGDERPPAEEVNDLGVNVALSMLKFYKREISPLLPSSCRYVPTCSEYSMQAYKRYGVLKGLHHISYLWDFSTVLSDVHAGGYGYDPPRWFGEEDLPPQ